MLAFRRINDTVRECYYERVLSITVYNGKGNTKWLGNFRNIKDLVYALFCQTMVFRFEKRAHSWEFKRGSR